MYRHIQEQKNTIGMRFICSILILSFSLSLIAPQAVYAQNLLLPAPGTMVTPSSAHTPALMLGMTINPQDPLKLDFIIDRGTSGLYDDKLKSESQKLLEYFYAALTVPEDEMWVNLSPYEQDRIIANGLGDTLLGRDMLAQDYLLKQLSASISYPESELGKTFWKRVNEEIRAKYGDDEILPTNMISDKKSEIIGRDSDRAAASVGAMNTFNKIWILPDTASVYTHEESVFVVENKLKVMLEEDYLALSHNSGSKSAGDPITGVTNEIVREIIIPAIEKEVNEGENFAPLRQMFHSMILATWYKQNLKTSILSQMIANQNKTAGITIEDTEATQKIYDQYVKAFEEGVYDYIKEEVDPATGDMIPRKYFSGGVKGQVTLTDQEVGWRFARQHANSVVAQSEAQPAFDDATDAAMKAKDAFQKTATELNDMILQLGTHDLGIDQSYRPYYSTFLMNIRSVLDGTRAGLVMRGEMEGTPLSLEEMFYVEESLKEHLFKVLNEIPPLEFDKLPSGPSFRRNIRKMTNLRRAYVEAIKDIGNVEIDAAMTQNQAEELMQKLNWNNKDKAASLPFDTSLPHAIEPIIQKTLISLDIDADVYLNRIQSQIEVFFKESGFENTDFNRFKTRLIQELTLSASDGAMIEDYNASQNDVRGYVLSRERQDMISEDVLMRDFGISGEDLKRVLYDLMAGGHINRISVERWQKMTEAVFLVDSEAGTDAAMLQTRQQIKIELEAIDLLLQRLQTNNPRYTIVPKKHRKEKILTSRGGLGIKENQVVHILWAEEDTPDYPLTPNALMWDELATDSVSTRMVRLIKQGLAKYHPELSQEIGLVYAKKGGMYVESWGILKEGYVAKNGEIMLNPLGKIAQKDSLIIPNLIYDLQERKQMVSKIEPSDAAMVDETPTDEEKLNLLQTKERAVNPYVDNLMSTTSDTIKIMQELSVFTNTEEGRSFAFYLIHQIGEQKVGTYIFKDSILLDGNYPKEIQDDEGRNYMRHPFTNNFMEVVEVDSTDAAMTVDIPERVAEAAKNLKDELAKINELILGNQLKSYPFIKGPIELLSSYLEELIPGEVPLKLVLNIGRHIDAVKREISAVSFPPPSIFEKLVDALIQLEVELKSDAAMRMEETANILEKLTDYLERLPNIPEKPFRGSFNDVEFVVEEGDAKEDVIRKFYEKLNEERDERAFLQISAEDERRIRVAVDIALHGDGPLYRGFLDETIQNMLVTFLTQTHDNALEQSLTIDAVQAVLSNEKSSYWQSSSSIETKDIINLRELSFLQSQQTRENAAEIIQVFHADNRHSVASAFVAVDMFLQIVPQFLADAAMNAEDLEVLTVFTQIQVASIIEEARVNEDNDEMLRIAQGIVDEIFGGSRQEIVEPLAEGLMEGKTPIEIFDAAMAEQAEATMKLPQILEIIAVLKDGRANSDAISDESLVYAFESAKRLKEGYELTDEARFDEMVTKLSNAIRVLTTYLEYRKVETDDAMINNLWKKSSFSLRKAFTFEPFYASEDYRSLLLRSLARKPVERNLLNTHGDLLAELWTNQFAEILQEANRDTRESYELADTYEIFLQLPEQELVLIDTRIISLSDALTLMKFRANNFLTRLGKNYPGIEIRGFSYEKGEVIIDAAMATSVRFFPRTQGTRQFKKDQLEGENQAVRITWGDETSDLYVYPDAENSDKMIVQFAWLKGVSIAPDILDLNESLVFVVDEIDTYNRLKKTILPNDLDKENLIVRRITNLKDTIEVEVTKSAFTETRITIEETTSKETLSSTLTRTELARVSEILERLVAIKDIPEGERTKEDVKYYAHHAQLVSIHQKSQSFWDDVVPYLEGLEEDERKALLERFDAGRAFTMEELAYVHLDQQGLYWTRLLTLLAKAPENRSEYESTFIFRSRHIVEQFKDIIGETNSWNVFKQALDKISQSDAAMSALELADVTGRLDVIVRGNAEMVQTRSFKDINGAEEFERMIRGLNDLLFTSQRVPGIREALLTNSATPEEARKLTQSLSAFVKPVAQFIAESELDIAAFESSSGFKGAMEIIGLDQSLDKVIAELHLDGAGLVEMQPKDYVNYMAGAPEGSKDREITLILKEDRERKDVIYEKWDAINAEPGIWVRPADAAADETSSRFYKFKEINVIQVAGRDAAMLTQAQVSKIKPRSLNKINKMAEEYGLTAFGVASQMFVYRSRTRNAKTIYDLPPNTAYFARLIKKAYPEFKNSNDKALKEIQKILTDVEEVAKEDVIDEVLLNDHATDYADDLLGPTLKAIEAVFAMRKAINSSMRSQYNVAAQQLRRASKAFLSHPTLERITETKPYNAKLTKRREHAYVVATLADEIDKLVEALNNIDEVLIGYEKAQRGEAEQSLASLDTLLKEFRTILQTLQTIHKIKIVKGVRFNEIVSISKVLDRGVAEKVSAGAKESPTPDAAMTDDVGDDGLTPQERLAKIKKNFGRKISPDEIAESQRKQGDVTQSLHSDKGSPEYLDRMDGALKNVKKTKPTALDRDDADSAMKTKGGIDFNANNLNLQAPEEPIQFDLDPATLPFNPLSVQGVVPLILNIVPVANLPLLLGLNKEKYFREEDLETLANLT